MQRNLPPHLIRARAQHALQFSPALQVLCVRRPHRPQVAPLNLQQTFQLGSHLAVPGLRLRLPGHQLAQPRRRPAALAARWRHR
eukprot:scaffold17553_cov112-Isochrysis_galbana.AAC.1